MLSSSAWRKSKFHPGMLSSMTLYLYVVSLLSVLADSHVMEMIVGKYSLIKPTKGASVTMNPDQILATLKKAKTCSSTTPLLENIENK